MQEPIFTFTEPKQKLFEDYVSNCGIYSDYLLDNEKNDLAQSYYYKHLNTGGFFVVSFKGINDTDTAKWDLLSLRRGNSKDGGPMSSMESLDKYLNPNLAYYPQGTSEDKLTIIKEKMKFRIHIVREFLQLVREGDIFNWGYMPGNPSRPYPWYKGEYRDKAPNINNWGETLFKFLGIYPNNFEALLSVRPDLKQVFEDKLKA